METYVAWNKPISLTRGTRINPSPLPERPAWYTGEIFEVLELDRTELKSYMCDLRQVSLLSNSLPVPGLDVVAIKEGRRFDGWKMLSTTLSIKQSLKNSSNRGTNTPHVGMETTLHGKKQPHLCHHCV